MEVKIGKYVRRAREFRGLNRTELARLTGKKAGYISKVESDGVTRPNTDLIVLISKALNCNASFLLGQSEIIEINSYNDAIIKYLKDLKPKQQEHCIAILKASADAFRTDNIMENSKPVKIYEMI